MYKKKEKKEEKKQKITLPPSKKKSGHATKNKPCMAWRWGVSEGGFPAGIDGQRGKLGYSTNEVGERGWKGRFSF